MGITKDDLKEKPWFVENSINYLVSMTNETDIGLLKLLIEDAYDDIALYTNRTILPSTFITKIKKLALINYNKIGAEGETERSEAGDRHVYDVQRDEVYKSLKKYRIAHVLNYHGDWNK